MMQADLINSEDMPLEEADHIDHSAIERGMTAVAALRHRNEVLERMTNDAVLALKGRDVELETLRLALAERDNRIATIQAECDDRVRQYQGERDIAVHERSELAVFFEQIKHLLQRIQLPTPRLPPPISDGIPDELVKKVAETKLIKRKRNGDEQPETGK